jgi:hypothetical protein
MTCVRNIAIYLLGTRAVNAMTGAQNIATRNGRHVGMNAVRTLTPQAHTIFSFGTFL